MLLFTINFIIAGVILLIFWIISKDITWKEALTQFGIQSLMILMLCACIRQGTLTDSEIISGRIASKNKEEVSCHHDYKCNCYYTTECSTDSNGQQSCYQEEHCSTCYEHDYDMKWFADTNINHRVYIDTVDRQGVKEPSRWTKIRIGEPASFHHSYTNYLKADPDSLFQYEMSEEEIKKYPAYPENIYDYYRINRGIGVRIEEGLSEVNADIGPAVQANLVMIVTNKPNTYAKAIQRAWSGAKKNDIVAVMGIDNSLNIIWTEVVGISYPDFKVKLRNTINNHGKLDTNLLPTMKQTILKNFKRRPMSEFEYLKESYKPTIGEWIFSLIVSLILSIGMGIYFHKEDAFGEQSYRRRY